MKKRDPDIEEMTAADAGKGVSTRIVDSALWTNDPNPRIWIEAEDENNIWIRALLLIDKMGDSQYLAELLRSETELSYKDQQHIADCLDRHAFKAPLVTSNERGNKQFFIELLRSQSLFGRNDRQRLADMLPQLKKPRGRPEIPSYDRSNTMGELKRAKARVIEFRDECRSQGRKMDIDKAVTDFVTEEEFAKKFPGITREALRLYCKGQHRSARHIEKRRP